MAEIPHNPENIVAPIPSGLGLHSLRCDASRKAAVFLGFVAFGVQDVEWIYGGHSPDFARVIFAGASSVSGSSASTLSGSLGNFQVVQDNLTETVLTVVPPESPTSRIEWRPKPKDEEA